MAGNQNSGRRPRILDINTGKAMLRNLTRPALKTIEKTIKDGDAATARWLWEMAIGRPSQQVELSAQIDHTVRQEQLQEFTLDQLRAMLAEIQPGQRVLINGAGGGAGTFAVQIAKSFGAEVTGVDSTGKLDMLLSIGADHVIDYTQEDFTKNGQRYDRIVDMAAHHSTFDYKRALSPKGIYSVIGGSTPRILQTVFLGPWISLIGSKKMGLVLHKPNKDLAFMIELFEAGKVVPVIDRRCRLNEVPEALRYFGEGHARGKVVITV